MIARPDGSSSPTRRPRLLTNRMASDLRPPERLGRQIDRDALLVELSTIDRELAALHSRRVGLLTPLEELRDELWPRVERYRGRRPEPAGEPALDPLPADHRYLWGRSLRASCLAILRRHGRLSLRDLHSLLHLYGYGIAGAHPVKLLADSMAYETRRGRARRVERGVYEIDPRFRPRRGRFGHPDDLPPIDPLLRESIFERL
jgi:hypothetical protein